MAKFQLSFFFLFCIVLRTHAQGQGRKVGGRTPVKNVDENTHIQELGRYCVHLYNIQHLIVIASNANPHPHLLAFIRVVAAQTQVVSGIKYFLKISASTQHAGTTTFDAVLLVKPWLHSKELLAFSPASTST